MGNLKKILRGITPPLLVSLVNRAKNKAEYRGDYQMWENAKADATGYDAVAIFEKVKNARVKVMRGEASYERDSLTFKDTPQFWPVIASLLFAASKSNNSLNILDFGGSLGTSYFQVQPFLKHLSRVRWSIVEQPNFVDWGNQNLANEQLTFYKSIDECLKKETPSVALFSSSLQYVHNPHEILNKITSANLNSLIFDRTTFTQKEKDIVAVQHIPDRVFTGVRFPVWLFSKSSFVRNLQTSYDLVTEFPSIGNPISTEQGAGMCMGMLFEKKDN
ncbi:MAG: hypothetical protein A2664_00760 [Candidatus Taylorbacteria bacterium RIFCSPHIGHO2_01_FULL_46_22b]|uniref:Methyltransferase, TIGR04325 family n=1 Tax=Candidatus Taylorbacteria bacterium RIFCSPHIGHO2_01_FULL_46_22b TaxID=1802301 RepID=A0A1G2M5R6_9BACT|nr:MAG: hypothetical protein A2664_00760 [Candidatus Taylorbacteria bacterium RIFCSPHIGHO2_01_FULL_46_22b]